jgi:RNA polymerase-binding transcription factor DksA
MANKKDKKKDKKAKAAPKPAKKASKPTAKKSVAKKPAKPAPKNAAKPAAKKTVKPTAKSAPKKTIKPAPAIKKIAASKPEKAKAKVAEIKKPAVAKAKPEPKKPAGKPINAVAKKSKVEAASKKSGKGKTSKAAEEDEEDEEEEKVDSYEKPDEDDAVIDGELDEAGLVDLEGVAPPEVDDDDDEVPEKRGRGRRKKSEGHRSGSGMEAYIRNRPLQIDINKPLIKKGNTTEPKPFVNTGDGRTRYSDKELAEFKELIIEKLKEAQDDYDLLKQTLSNEDNHGTDDTSPSFKLLEDGSDVMSKEETAQLASRQEKYIVNLKNALVRIENKSYGICRVTGKLIPKERLRSVPHATLGIDAKLGQSN